MEIHDKVTFYYPPTPEYFPNVSLEASAQYPGPKVFNSPYSLRNYNFHAPFTTTKTPQKKPKIIIDDKVNFHNPPAPEVSPYSTNYSSAWIPVFTVFNSPYSSINRNK